MLRSAAVFALLFACSASAQETTSVAVAKMADGSEVPLAGWKLAYEYSTWKEGTSPAFAEVQKKEGQELISDKKLLPVAGARLEIQYRLYDKTDDQGQKVPGAVVTGLVLTQGGAKTNIKPTAPHKDALAGDVKKVIYQARVLDLTGETLAGTKRQLCLVSFSPLVECSALPGERVVSVEFR